MTSSKMEQFQLPGGRFGYAGTRMDDLQSTEYTLATILMDESGSTVGFRPQMEMCLKEIVKALRGSPRKDNLLLRVAAFSTSFREIHGFKMLNECNLDDYDSVFGGAGRTALYESTTAVVEATTAEAKRLGDQEYGTNSIIAIMTDGCEWGSDQAFTIDTVRDALAQAVASEELESMMSILIGVNIKEPHIKDTLEDFKNQVRFDQFESVDNADEKSLRKIAGFVSKSVMSQSQALGSGGPSQSLTF